MLQNTNLVQVLVENADGVQYCDAFERTIVYSVLSGMLPIPAHKDTISVIQLEGHEFPSLKITRTVGTNRTISAFVSMPARLRYGLPAEFEQADALRFSLTDGTEILTFGDAEILDATANNQSQIVVTIVADALPVMTEVSVPLAAVRATYSELDIGLTALSALVAILCLLTVFNYMQQLRLPAVDLERAISSGEFKPYYQPMMNLSTGRISGCEVLVRWEKKGGEIVSPGMFIEYAEATGLAIPMTNTMMQQVRDDLSEFCTEFPDLRVSINLFEGHFNDTAIVEDVEAIFGGSGIGYRQLTFEITERKPLENEAAAGSVISGLHALGCRLAMDDVGAGHSNLAYMETRSIDIIKIDRVFVDMIGPDTDHVPILDALITMAGDLGTEIVAEGVETQEQAVYLRERGVFVAQGFLFAPALKAGAFQELTRALNGTPDPSVAPDSQKTEAA
jgi:sensor c-di-GMP phosphodiesterase-like protein